MKKSFWIVLLSFVISVTAFSKDHKIVLIGNLIEKASEAVWTGVEGKGIDFDGDDGLNGWVSRGIKKGGINGMLTNPKTLEISFDDDIYADTVDVEFAPTLGRRNVEIRGSYILTLPSMKRIQLELRYDKISDEFGQASQSDFYVEIALKNAKNQWHKVKVFEDGDESVDRTLYKIDDETFSSHVVVDTLSEFAGKEIKLDLVGRVPADVVTTQRGRWLEAKLIGMTFDFVFEDIQISGNQSLMKAKKSGNQRTSGVRINYTTYYNNAETITTNDIYNPEGFTVAHIDGRWFAYGHGVNSSGSRGTYVYDLRNYLSTYNFFNTNVSLLSYSILRGTTVANATPGLSGYPFFLLTSQPNTWYGTYVGMGSIITNERTPGNTYLHGFLHAENRNGYTDGCNVYKIGYARSRVANHGYDLEMMPLDGHNDPDVIIESFEPDEWSQEKPQGTGAPCVIEYGDYLYLFYSRWIKNPQLYDCDYNLGNTTPGICVARAIAGQVYGATYSSDPNPWRNYFDGDWNSPTTGSQSFSTTVVRDCSGSWRHFPQVIYNELLETYMLVCNGGSVGDIYLYLSNDFTNWGTGAIFMSGVHIGSCTCTPGVDGCSHYLSALYPKFIGYTGSGKTAIEYSCFTCPTKLYYSWDNGDCYSGGHSFMRRGIVFYE